MTFFFFILLLSISIGAVGKCSRTPEETENRVNNTRTEQYKRLEVARNINKAKDECEYKPKKKCKMGLCI